MQSSLHVHAKDFAIIEAKLAKDAVPNRKQNLQQMQAAIAGNGILQGREPSRRPLLLLP